MLPESKGLFLLLNVCCTVHLSCVSWGTRMTFVCTSQCIVYHFQCTQTCMHSLNKYIWFPVPCNAYVKWHLLPCMSFKKKCVVLFNCRCLKRAQGQGLNNHLIFTSLLVRDYAVDGRVQPSVTFRVATADNGKKQSMAQICQARSNGQELMAEVKQGTGVTWKWAWEQSLREMSAQANCTEQVKIGFPYLSSKDMSSSTSQYEPAG